VRRAFGSDDPGPGIRKRSDRVMPRAPGRNGWRIARTALARCVPEWPPEGDGAGGHGGARVVRCRGAGFVGRGSGIASVSGCWLRVHGRPSVAHHRWRTTIRISSSGEYKHPLWHGRRVRGGYVQNFCRDLSRRSWKLFCRLTDGVLGPRR